MPRIPDSNALGRVIPRATSSVVVDQSAEIAANSVGQVGAVLGRIVDRQYEEQQQLARAKDASGYLDHQLGVKSLEQSYRDRIANGEISYEDAETKFKTEAAALPAPKPVARDKAAAEVMTTGVKRNIEAASLGIGQAVKAARSKDLQSQGALQLDTLGKLAGMPDANIEAINRDADAVTPLLRTAGLDEAQTAKVIQDFKDRNWLNQATQRAMQSKDSLVAIKALEHDLTAADGFYAGKLDTDRRNAVLRQVISDRAQIENRIQHAADKREAKAERTLYQIDAQIASGVPATAEMWNSWADTVKGTLAEHEFKDRLHDESEVQSVLRQPIDRQVQFIQDQEAALLKDGGTPRDRTNLARLKSAVQANVTQLQTNPLLFSANRNGQDVDPIDVSMLGDPQTGVVLQDRIATLEAMHKQYGTPIKPLLPQEANQLTAALNAATPREQAEIFADLRNSIADPAAYRAAMNQIAPDAPVKAMAGMLSAKQAQMTTGTHWFKPDETIASRDVAATMLAGEQLLNPSKSAKGEDGKPKTGLYLPETRTLQSSFQDAVGSAFAGRPQAAEIAFQAVQAYYVGRASQTGRLASSGTDIDADLVQESIKATLGGVSDYNGAGEVLIPWGMSEDAFEDRVQAKLRGLGATGRGANALADAGLKNHGDGTYFVTHGRSYALDNKGQPIVIDINQ